MSLRKPNFLFNRHHNNHLGTPQELTDKNGNVVWANYEYAWGGTYQSYYKEQSLNGIVIDKDELQPLKFQGQFYDVETGLHYNRFRYYDSDVGMFIQRDPIGLLGGNNVFQYAPNPIHWVDPWGLSAKKLRNSIKADQRSIDKWQTPHHIVQENSGKSPYSQHSRNLLDRNNIGIDSSPNGAVLAGTHPNQVNNPAHPGVGSPTYHAGQHLHGPDADKLIYRILRSAEKKGLSVSNTLREIGKRMEVGTWKNSLSACTGNKY